MKSGGSYSADRDALAEILAWDVAAEGRGEIDALGTEGETVRVRLWERNRFIKLLELEAWRTDRETSPERSR